ncbi:transcriptional regulator with XRE-family HTH domain [Kineosphaera limosa]|uniref:Putative Xre family DNA-binding protein n=1 Tax=Kineosphaera limosa NBRC 100340 TaxID=1184609 RepID=K6XAA1_9MICO|nr:helix-turn-helix transcriptional regulator [Kineosphaera limosa]NYE00072.1 transcriptional regulator with XRE-family HTH domain [Kineosphaera limosa]GAB95754.1 putative Xre family DNA-binding protein [Kineosphaera limosa NBRC 100340]
MSTVLPLRQGRPKRRVRPEPLWREAVGDVLREERAERGERIADVAARAGVAPQYLSEIERGRKDPSSEVLAAVCGALDLTVREVATRASGTMSRNSAGTVCLAA